MEKIKRDTSTDLMNNVLALVKENGCYAKAEKIMDYFLTEDFDNRELSDYQFDFSPLLISAAARVFILTVLFAATLTRMPRIRNSSSSGSVLLRRWAKV